MVSNGTYKEAVTTLAGEANKALFSLTSKASCCYYHKLALLSHLFDSLVRPILERASKNRGAKSAEEVEC